MTAYYNEIDPYAAAWLRNLIAAGHIAPGDVDERSITEVSADDVRNYTQCHWFAGIGGWSIALRIAGWSDARRVWTGSCPCQPFSVAGKGKAQSDERHLWPAWFNLIKSVQPPVVFGEQVAGAIAYGWLDDAFDDLEGQGYKTAACVLPACSVGAPHKRDRLWFVADSDSKPQRRQTLETDTSRNRGETRMGITLGSSRPDVGESVQIMAGAEPHVDDSESRGRGFWNTENERQTSGTEYAPRNAGETVADTNNKGSQGRNGAELSKCAGEQFAGSSGSHDVSNAAQFTSDGARPATPRSERFEVGGCNSVSDTNFWEFEPPLGRVANGVPARAHKLRAYGNAIVPQVAAEFIKAYSG